jgi:hypothetical protein
MDPFKMKEGKELRIRAMKDREFWEQGPEAQSIQMRPL